MAYNEKGEILNGPGRLGNTAHPNPNHIEGVDDNLGQRRRNGGASWLLGLAILCVVVVSVVMIATVSNQNGGEVSSEPFCRLAPNEGPSKQTYRQGETVTIDFMGWRQTLLCVDPIEGRNGFEIIDQHMIQPTP